MNPDFSVSLRSAAPSGARGTVASGKALAAVTK